MKLRYQLCVVMVLALISLLLVSVASAQPPVPHSLEGRDDCLACHQTGVGGAPRVAADHVGRTNETCGQCHVPVGVEPAAVPAIPHPTEGREACLACHEAGVGGASKIPDDHVGRTEETCGLCHAAAGATPTPASPVSPILPLIPHPVEEREACLSCHEAGVGGAPKTPGDHAGRTDETCRQCHIATGVTPAPVPPVPHPVEDREACLACHAGWMGQAPLVPDDHAERPNEVCQLCHQPPVLIVATPTPLPLPTPIVHPLSPAEDSCLECHGTLGGKYAEIAYQWEGSYFATFGVTCADCHGGDPGADDIAAAKSPETGYIGVPDRADVPSLCGSCHSDAERMAPHGLPTDQLSEYRESVHGQLLAQGDENVPTCFDCHGGHATLGTDDPRSSVYPSNLPVTCAQCHADEERMEPYGIPTNQYELYQTSVHGRALMIDGNLEAPTCATCHSSHGATLPGTAELIDVCGECHSLSEKYYLTGGHGSGRQKGSEAPRCVTCHGRYDVEPASLELFLSDGPRGCGSCHLSGSLESAAIDVMYQTLAGAEQALQAAEQAMEEARAAELSLDAQESRLEKARTRFAEAVAAQHELQLETIEEKTAEVESISAEVQEAVEEAISEREWEGLLPGRIAAVVLALGGAVLIVLRRRAKVS